VVAVGEPILFNPQPRGAEVMVDLEGVLDKVLLDQEG
jgi:hypothetical protein